MTSTTQPQPKITIVGDDRLSDSAIAAMAALLLAASEERGADDLPHLHRGEDEDTE